MTITPEMTVEQRCVELNLDVFTPIPPLGSYASAVSHNGLVFTSGIVGLRSPDWATHFPGRFGDDLSPEDAYLSARAAMVSTLANVRGHVGSLDLVSGALKVTGFIQTTSAVMGLPGLLNGATDLLADLFGADSVPARSAVGVAALPGGASVELECIFAVR